MALIYQVSIPGERAQTFEDEYDAANCVTSSDAFISNLEVDVDETLDECYGKIEIAGQEFWASRILYELDETAYNEYLYEEQQSCAENDSDWVSEQIGNLDADETTNFPGGITVRAIETEDEEEDDEWPELIDNEEEFGFIFK